MKQAAEAAYLDLPVPGGAPDGWSSRPVHAGVDLVDEDRLERALDRYGAPLRERLFGPDAAIGGADPAVAAGTFGIKESVVKAAGGLPPGGRLAAIQVQPDGTVQLEGALADWARAHRLEIVGGYTRLRPGLTLSWVFAVAGGTGSTPC